MRDKFVISWVTSKYGGEENPWVMVLHEERGWEFPGGTSEPEEKFDIAALRELYEETGLLGTAKAYDEDLVEGGVVVWIEVEDEPGPEPWQKRPNYDCQSFRYVGKAYSRNPYRTC